MGPLVSVIITCFNNATYVGKAIESVTNQTYKNIECIVVDDGSTDNSREIINSYVKRDSRIYYFHKENGGVSSAKNFGISKSNGNWVQILDSDDWLYSSKIEKQLSYVSGKSGCENEIIIYSDYEIVDERDLEFTNKKKVIIGNLTKKELLNRIIGRKFGLGDPTVLHINSVLISKKIFDNFKFDENMVTCGDVDFFYRVLKTNTKFFYVPVLSMCYRSNESGISKNKKKLLRGYTSLLYNIEENDLTLFPNFEKMLQNSINFNDYDTFKKLEYLLLKKNIPVYLNKNKEYNISIIYVFISKIGLLKLFIKLKYQYNRFKGGIIRRLS